VKAVLTRSRINANARNKEHQERQDALQTLDLTILQSQHRVALSSRSASSSDRWDVVTRPPALSVEKHICELRSNKSNGDESKQKSLEQNKEI
jgi:hypothetical protein